MISVGFIYLSLKLETDHLKLTQETAVCHDNMMSLRKKDSEATSLIGELTAVRIMCFSYGLFLLRLSRSKNHILLN